MKKTIFLLFIALFAIEAKAQSEPANYTGVVNKFKLFYNTNQPDSIYSMFGPEMKAAMTADQCKDMVTQFRAHLGTLKNTSFTSYDQSLPAAVYKADFQSQTIALSLSLNKQNQMIGLYFRPVKETPAAASTTAASATTTTPAATQTPAATRTMDPSLVESPIVLKTLSGSIHGTLTMPQNATGKIPVVLIIAGSGPTDRNGNSVKLGLNTNAYLMIAEGLGKNGIASVRYDKRMVGESETHNKEIDLRFDDYVDDAVGLIGMLVDDPRFSKVIVLGHSEGSLVGMLACHDQPVKGFISIAGAGDQADKIVTDQMKSQPQFIQDEFKTLLDSMKRGKTIDNIDASLYFIARPSIQKYLMSWFKYDPQRIMKRTKTPTLIVQGTTDLQIKVADADKLKKAKSDATLVIIPNMNHVLKEAPADRDKNLATYDKPDLPLKAELIPALVSFINKLD